jgi:hypothetical protein
MIRRVSPQLVGTPTSPPFAMDVDLSSTHVDVHVALGVCSSPPRPAESVQVQPEEEEAAMSSPPPSFSSST